MKSNFFLRNAVKTVAALAVSISLFTGCDKDPNNEPDEPAVGTGTAETGHTYVSTTATGDRVYTLQVTENKLKSTAAEDTYVLLYVDKTGTVRTSTGTVTAADGDELTLRRSLHGNRNQGRHYVHCRQHHLHRQVGGSGRVADTLCQR